jgi:hypothetical protein
MPAPRSTALLAALSVAVLPLTGAPHLASAAPSQRVSDPARAYERVVQRVAEMVGDDRATSLVERYKLQLLDVLWEDTGRWQGSSVGPNISDVTIEVEAHGRGSKRRTYLMPVMRHDNFTDKTADVKIEKIMIPVGNHRKGGGLQLVSLTELLSNPMRYLSSPGVGTIKGDSLLAKRDTHVLVSAQHAFLPVPKEGKATFYPVIFNYQSTEKNPAVLTILVTRQGTSMTIIDNERDTVGNGYAQGQRLYFNDGGERAPLIAERLADVKAAGVTANGEDAQSLADDANVLMLIQVPLEYRASRRKEIATATSSGAMLAESAAPLAKSAARGFTSDVDTAVIGHGPTEGPYTELDGLTIKRDARFPIRVTLQFYQATSNGVLSHANVKAMAAQIRKVYGKGDYVGSLVVPSGLDRQRPTNWTGTSPAPAELTWDMFPGLVARLGLALVPPRVGVL